MHKKIWEALKKGWDGFREHCTMRSNPGMYFGYIKLLRKNKIYKEALEELANVDDNSNGNVIAIKALHQANGVV